MSDFPVRGFPISGPPVYPRKGFGPKDPRPPDPPPDPEPLSAGVYWQAGIVEAPPLTEEGWTSGLPSSVPGNSVTVLRVLAAPVAWSAWSATVAYDGSLSQAFKVWGGASYQVGSDFANSWGIHFSWQEEGNSGSAMGGDPASAAYLMQWTQGTPGTPIEARAFGVT